MIKKNRLIIVLALLILGTIFAISLNLSWGSYKIPINRIPKILFWGGKKLENIVIFSLRLPRLIQALIVGSALSVAGSILQTITRNELADSGIIGINAGAALFAVIYITSQSTFYYDELGYFTIYTLPFIAMLGSFFAVLIIYLFSNRKGVSPRRLILVGVGINIAINAFIAFYSLRVSQGQFNRVLVWTSGSLWGSNWQYIYVSAPLILLFLGLTLYKHKTLDVINLGDELATGLGLDVNKERKQFLFYSVVLAGVATAVAGNISFLGLISPHIARQLVGPTHKKFIITGIFISTIIILVADSLSRNVFSPIEIPVGITISIIGVPYFIYLMIKEKS